MNLLIGKKAIEGVILYTNLNAIKYMFIMSVLGGGGRIGTRFLHPRGTNPLKLVNPVGTPMDRNRTQGLLRLEGASVGCAGCINSQPTHPSDET